MSKNNEILFATTLEDVRKLAKSQGNCVSEQQVRDAFASMELAEEQIQMVFDYLVKHKVGIGTPVNPDDFLSDEEKNYLQEYMEEIESLPVLSEGELKGYTIAAMAGESDAQQMILQAYLKDAIDIAKLYAGQGVFLEDLIGEGNLALAMGVTMLGSMESPDEIPGMLAKMMMDAMEAYIAENTENEKTDQKLADKVNKVADKAKELAEDMHRKVTPEELAEETGMSVKAIKDACRISGFKIEDIDYAEEGV